MKKLFVAILLLVASCASFYGQAMYDGPYDTQPSLYMSRRVFVQNGHWTSIPYATVTNPTYDTLVVTVKCSGLSSFEDTVIPARTVQSYILGNSDTDCTISSWYAK